jgi:hypothetical protein
VIITMSNIPPSAVPDFSMYTKEQLDLIRKNAFSKARRKIDLWVEMMETGDYSRGSPMSSYGELPSGAEAIPGELCCYLSISN